MSNKIILKHYRGLMWGAGFGLIVSLLSFLQVIDILNGMFLFCVSIPFSVWVYLHSLKFSISDFFSSILFILLLSGYFALLGQLIFSLSPKVKVIKYWILFVVLILNILAYQHSVNILNGLGEGIRKLFG